MNQAGVVGTESFTITVSDPNAIYAGLKTTCVNPAGDTNFSEAPAGSRQVSTNDLSTITQYATAGSRILFKRGSTWTTAGLTAWPENAGPVTIGSYGSGAKPLFAITSGNFFNLSYKQDWRVMDLDFVNSDKNASVISGLAAFQRITLLRLNTEGFDVPIGWTYWNEILILPIDSLAVVECNVHGARTNGMYLGAERLALLGNTVAAIDDSHVVRVWQAYKSVISHNMHSGSSLTSGTGRHALKFHGPTEVTLSPRQNSSDLRYLSGYTLVSDNIFGSSGPWPVVIGPEDGGKNCAMSNIIFERNRVVTQYGSLSSTNVQLGLYASGRYYTIRNNIFDGTGSSSGYTGVSVTNRGIEPPPLGVNVFNNTIFRSDNSNNGNFQTGIQIGASTSNTAVRNNLVSFPGTNDYLVRNLGTGTIESNNNLNGTISFTDPDNASPLLRNFSLAAGSSSAIDQGYALPSVFEDYAGNPRPAGGAYDIGAYEQ